jgi:heat shock protein HtpX
MTQQQPVLIYDRIEANRRRTRLFLILFALVLLPAAAYVALYVSFVAAIFTLGLGSLISGDDWLVGLILGALVAVSIIMAAAFLEYRYAAALVLRLAGARPLGPDEDPVLQRTAENLCIGAGLPQPKLYIIESLAPNAFAAGLDPEHASLAVTRGLLVLLDDRELEGVTAHELSHIGNYDTRLSTVVAMGVALLRLPLLIVVGFFRLLFRLHWAVGVGALLYIVLPILASIPFSVSLTMDELESDPRLGLLMLLSASLPFYVALGAPALGQLIQRAVSREREFLADADAALLTRYPEGLARALAKIGAASGVQLKAGAATAHLFIIDPRSPDAPRWERIFSSHPPIEERIELLAQMGGGIAPSVLQAATEAGAAFARTHAPTVVAKAVYREAMPPMEEPRHSAEAGLGGIAFRLNGPGADLCERPSMASKRLAHLPSGSMITVLEEEGEFLRVITGRDEFGYVMKSAPMTPVETPVRRPRSAR